MNGNPFEFELLETVFILYQGKIIEGYIEERRCVDTLLSTKSKTRSVYYSMRSNTGGRFRDQRDHELFRTKLGAVERLLEDAGVEPGLIDIR